MLTFDGKSFPCPEHNMGGHAAWRKRVAQGGLAKGSGGAALRHRPRWGRRGADLALNRKGNLGGFPNPKRKKTRKKTDEATAAELKAVDLSTVSRWSHLTQTLLWLTSSLTTRIIALVLAAVVFARVKVASS